jgi:hypothetical protein
MHNADGPSALPASRSRDVLGKLTPVVRDQQGSIQHDLAGDRVDGTNPTAGARAGGFAGGGRNDGHSPSLTGLSRTSS